MTGGKFIRAIPLAAVFLLGCASGFPGAGNGQGPSSISVTPSSMNVLQGSVSDFTAVLMPNPTAAGLITWSVTPQYGGTITNSGVFTASANQGNYIISVTWTPANATGVGRLIGSATVVLLPAIQIESVLTTELTQASGATQVAGVIQNNPIVGQPVPAMTSTDSSGNPQNRSGFTPPMPCPGTNPPANGKPCE